MPKLASPNEEAPQKATPAPAETSASGHSTEEAEMNRLALLFFTLSLTACLSGEDEALIETPRSDCEALRDHPVDVSVTTAAGAPPKRGRVSEARIAAELDKHRQNLKSNFAPDWLHRCQFERDPEWVRCSLTAHDKAALAACQANHPERSDS